MTLVPWLLHDEWPDGSAKEPTWVPDASDGTDVFGRYSTLDLRPYGEPQAILVTADYSDPLPPGQGAKRLDLGQYLDTVLGSGKAQALSNRLGVPITAGMTVGEALRVLIEPGLVPHRDGGKYSWLHQVDLMNDATASEPV